MKVPICFIITMSGCAWYCIVFAWEKFLPLLSNSAIWLLVNSNFLISSKFVSYAFYVQTINLSMLMRNLSSTKSSSLVGVYFPVVYDDDMVEKILDRNQVSEVPETSEEAEVNTGMNEYLRSFKVATYTLKEGAEEASLNLLSSNGNKFFWFLVMFVKLFYESYLQFTILQLFYVQTNNFLKEM